jgi:hypothetical protein
MTYNCSFTKAIRFNAFCLHYHKYFYITSLMHLTRRLSGVYSIVSMKQLASLENLGELKNDAFLALLGEVYIYGQIN